MSILALVAIGYFAGLCGSILGGIFDLARLRDARGTEGAHDSGGLLLVIFIVLLYKILTHKVLQSVKVLMAIGVACAVHGNTHAVPCTVGMCAFTGFTFMILLPPLLIAWNRLSTWWKKVWKKG